MVWYTHILGAYDAGSDVIAWRACTYVFIDVTFMLQKYSAVDGRSIYGVRMGYNTLDLDRLEDRTFQ